jgi:hypothetical protein
MEIFFLFLLVGGSIWVIYQMLTPKNLPSEPPKPNIPPRHTIPDKYFDPLEEWPDKLKRESKPRKRKAVPRKKVALDTEFQMSDTGVPYYAVIHIGLTRSPDDYDAFFRDFEKWPEVERIAYYVFDANSKLVYNKLLEFETDKLDAPGKYDEFLMDMRKVKALVTHNYSFVSTALKADFLRTNHKLTLFRRDYCCLMEATTDMVGIPGSYGENKWPKMEEMITKLFYPDEDPESYWPDNMNDFEWEAKALAKTFVKIS